MVQDTALLTAKVVAMVVLGGASILLGLTPLIFSWLHKRRAGGGGGGAHPLGTSRYAALFISLLLAFGGGALLCTTFLHLLPEVRETVEELQESGSLAETNFHLPELLMCAGFFAMYLVEEIVHLYLHHRRHRESPNRLRCGPGAQTTDSALHRSLSKRRCSRADASCPPGAADPPDVCDVEAQGTSGGTLVANGGAPTVHAVSSNALTDEDGKKLFNGTTSWTESSNKHVSHPAKHVQHGHAHLHVHLDVGDAEDSESTLSSLRGLLIVLALSVHELFEGLAVGLQETANLVYYMMGAVAAHKLVLAFCVGVQLIAAGTRPRYIICYVLTFALVSPIGIGVGLALGTEEGGSVSTSAATATLQGLACGTLLYVVFFEILQREAKGIRQYFSTGAGFLIMLAILVTTGEEHSHGHSHSHHHDHDHEDEAVTAAARLAAAAITETISNLTGAR